jgi:hypothetical protein
VTPHCNQPLTAASQCDLKRPYCSVCIRACEPCEGYRDPEDIRFHDQTEFIQTKATARAKAAHVKRFAASIKIGHLPLDLQALGRHMFFCAYVSDFSRAWEFLYPYLSGAAIPDHLASCIDAVSLAFLCHQVTSPTAGEMARRKYTEALRTINKAIQDPEKASKTSTLEGAMLLDLYEKITVSDLDTNVSRHAHLEGALALVKLRGVKNFRTAPEVKTILMLSSKALICALCTGKAIPKVVRQIREHIAEYYEKNYPIKWRLSDGVLEYIELRDEVREGKLTVQERIARLSELDRKLEQIALEKNPAWSYQRKFVTGHDQSIHVLPGFALCDIYPNRTVTQMWNVLRFTRILRCEEIIGLSATLEDADCDAESARAKTSLLQMVQEICASCPQMTDCDFAARHKLPNGAVPGMLHKHTMSHILDVYVLIFSLYVVAWSRNCPTAARDFVIGKLEHIAEHFEVKEAAVVLATLRRERLERVELW